MTENYFKQIKINFILFIGLIFLAVPVYSTTYYVSTTGSDSNPGSSSQPWRTIQKAANTLVAGDTVYVNTGTYNEVVDETTSGTASNMIHYVASGTVTIKGFNIRGNYIDVNGFTVTPTDCGSWNGAIDVTGNYCLVQNNIIRDSTRQGIALESSTTGCRIIGNTITRAHINGIFVTGTNHLIENNDISDIRDHTGSCSVWGEANAVGFHGSGHIFRGNYIHDFFKASQNGKPHVDAFQTYSDTTYGKPAAKNIIFEQNYVFMGNSATGTLEEAWDGSSTICVFMVEGSSSDRVNGITIRNNIFESWCGYNGNGLADNIKIYNNIFRSDLKFSSSYWPQAIQFDETTGFEIFNNILVDFAYAHISIYSSSSGGSYDYNLMWNSDGTSPRLDGYTIKSHDKYKINPLFVNNFGNLHLQSNSPAIDTGITLSNVANDYDGNSRPQGSAFDIGAYEFQGTPVTTTITTSTTTTSSSTTTSTTTTTTTSTTTLPDNPPQWFNLRNNPLTVLFGQAVDILVDWFDDLGIQKVIIEENSTGIWVNHTVYG